MPDPLGIERRPCPAEDCPGVEFYDGKIDGCGHPTKTSGCAFTGRGSLADPTTVVVTDGTAEAEAAVLRDRIAAAKADA